MDSFSEPKPTAKLETSNDASSTTGETLSSSSRDVGRVMKRTREDVAGQQNDSLEDNEPEEKRPTFRLNPPTLIHGKAKSVPKEEEEIIDLAMKRNFLRPSKLSAPAALMLVPPAASSSNGKSATALSPPALLGSGLLLTGQVPSNNPFLKTEELEDGALGDNSEGSVQANAEQKVNGLGSVSSTVDATPSFENLNGSKENVFLQMSNKSTKQQDDKNSESANGFVFGSKMEERVMKNEADYSSDDTESKQTKEEGSQFLFGENLSERIKVTMAEPSGNFFPTAPAGSLIFSESRSASTSDGVSSSTGHRRLEEDAAALFAASNTKPVIPEVEVFTGEEDEKNVLQVQCKLFQFDSMSQNWLERGRGNLRLNDKRLLSLSEQVFQSRLVMRTHGSLRLVLNTKIWDSMIIDRASRKSVRISAQNEDGDIGVYLIMATVNDAEQIYRALEYRVLHLKQLHEQEKSLKVSESPAIEFSDKMPNCDFPGKSPEETQEPEPSSTRKTSTDKDAKEENISTVTSGEKGSDGESHTIVPVASDSIGAGDKTTQNPIHEESTSSKVETTSSDIDAVEETK